MAFARVFFNLVLSFAGCAGFHIGQSAHDLQHAFTSFASFSFVAATLLCMAMNQAGLWQPPPRANEQQRKDDLK